MRKSKNLHLPSTRICILVAAIAVLLMVGLVVVRKSAAVNGTFTVGPTGTYPTLTNAISSINGAGGADGPIVLELQAAYTSAGETFPINPKITNASATNTITIRPESGATALLIQSSAAQVLNFDAASFVTIDGRPGGTGASKELTIDNTSTSGQAIRFINDSSNNTVKHCTVSGASTTAGPTGGVILFSTSAAGTTGNDNNTIDNCDIRDSATTPTNCIASTGSTTTATRNNSGNTISNNNIFNFYNSTSSGSGGVGINLGPGTTDWNITGNSFYQTSTRTTFALGTTVNAILISNSASGNNFVIIGNCIGGTAPLCGGTPYTINSSNSPIFRGIQATVTTTTPTSIQGNTIQNIFYHYHEWLSGPISLLASDRQFQCR